MYKGFKEALRIFVEDLLIKFGKKVINSELF